LKNTVVRKYLQALLLLKTEPKKFHKIKKMKMHINLRLIENIVKIKKFVTVLAYFRQLMLIKELSRFNKTLVYLEMNKVAFIYTGEFNRIQRNIYYTAHVGRFMRILSRRS